MAPPSGARNRSLPLSTLLALRLLGPLRLLSQVGPSESPYQTVHLPMLSLFDLADSSGAQQQDSSLFGGHILRHSRPL